MRRRQLNQAEEERIAEQEAREQQEIDEARQARERLQALYQDEQRKHPHGDNRSAAELVNKERGI
ncbi:MAG TPA: hypothetical protein VJN88_01925, partial [Ktedonobacterales bacterium]|nr:hypothetical protein [Ktedonobacterales bacterium]